ncbi:MAG TPA: DUF1365 family protein, partial [Planctomycetota bacterium]|nr:DUF1365 family protein [Planctomycetota bacterium]
MNSVTPGRSVGDDAVFHSALYEGVVTHRRERPLAHAFSYRLFHLYLDLAELPQAFTGT